MAKLVTLLDEKRGIEAAQIILEQCGAKEKILERKGTVDVFYKSLKRPGSVAYNAAVAIVDANGGNGKREITNFENKGYFTVSGTAGGIIRKHYELLASKA